MPSVSVRSGVELGQDASMDDLQNAELDGELDADMAEMSLGQRLTALTGQEEPHPGGSSSDDERKEGSSATKNASSAGAVPASSLTRTLIQALHSSDANLLETCLAHSNATLIQNTVRRLPSQLAIPLVTACVERLGRGRGVGRGKGGGAAASAQRGTGLVRWVRAVLVIHGGHLLTVRYMMVSNDIKIKFVHTDARPGSSSVRPSCYPLNTSRPARQPPGTERPS